jgi:uncharacterized membrane protein
MNTFKNVFAGIGVVLVVLLAVGLFKVFFEQILILSVLGILGIAGAAYISVQMDKKKALKSGNKKPLK